MAIQLKPRSNVGLERSVQGKDALKWIETAKVVLNGARVDIPIPHADDSRYVMFEYVKAVEDGVRYNIIFYEGSPRIAERNGYSTFGRGERGIQKNRIYMLPDDVKQIHLGTEKSQ